MSLPLTVCILTSGKGTRMGTSGKVLNKALHPINKKAMISWIIEKFPSDTIFVIGLGYLKAQVRDYLHIAHPELRFEFVTVDNFDGPGSGPGNSLFCCRTHLNKPFFFVSCDTLWFDEVDLPTNRNWVAVDRVPADLTPQYCNLQLNEDRVTKINDKVHVNDPNFRAFTGLCFIHSHMLFWEGIQKSVEVAGERQISNGLNSLIEKDDLHHITINWNDVGDSQKYLKTVALFEDYNFSKSDEAFYIINQKVIKFFKNKDIVKRRVSKSRLMPSLFPDISDVKDQFFAYKFLRGETLYENNNISIFSALLAWLKAEVWHPRDIDHDTFQKSCNRFYREKTNLRVNAYYEKYGKNSEREIINGKPIPKIAELLSNLNWADLSIGMPTFLHGDLQFDNIIYDKEREKFSLLDWRQDFSGHMDLGDCYYDLAKLYGGILLSYDYIKKNMLTYSEDKESLHIDFAQRYSSEQFVNTLSGFIRENGYNLERVKVIVGLIYINMSPLHHHPFDKVLNALGRITLYKSIQEGCSYAHGIK